MATKNIVPRSNNEGELGTSNKQWNKVNAKKIYENGTDISNKYLPLAGGTVTGAVNGVTPSAGDDSTKFATTEYVQEELRLHASIPIGHEYFSMNPNVPQGSLPLIGGEYSRSTYPDLWAWVQDQNGYLKTEAQWQALSTSNNGNVPFYSDGDGSTTFRVPSLHCWIKGSDGSAQLVGSYLEAGLPNITGGYNPMIPTNATGSNISVPTIASGAFANSSTGIRSYWSITGNTTKNDWGWNADFDASRSSAIYGNSNTVQPESIVGMWLVKAYGTIEDTGTIDEQQYIDDRIAYIENTYLPANYLSLSGGTITGDLTVSGSINGAISDVLIPNNSDLNDYTTVGFYYTNSDSSAQSLSNCPITVSFNMIVRRAGAGVVQMIINGGDIYTRRRTSTTWQSWYKHAGTQV